MQKSEFRVRSSEFGVWRFSTKYSHSQTVHTVINHNSRHSRESGNPERHWIPGQARNDKLRETCVFIHNYSELFCSQSGMTFIEVLLVVLIVGILAAVAIPRLSGTTSSGTSVDGAALMVASDIRYAQEFAMANRISKSVVFNSGSSVYTFAPPNAMDASGRLPSGVTIGSNFTITFNSLGEPTTGGGGSVTVSGGGQTKTITVVNYTGKINIS